MNLPIDVIAVFDPDGKITPTYVRLEDEMHRLITHKITQVKLLAEIIASIDYLCTLENGQDLKLTYFTASHKWVIKL